MKLLIPVFLAVALLGGVCGSAAAIDPNNPGKTDPDPEGGTWRARVKYLDPRQTPWGYSTYSYADITATSLAYCQSQLQSWMSGGNVTVVQYCWLDA